MKHNSTTVITGSKVVLVPYRKQHVPKYHKWMQSSELQELTASEPLSLEEEYQMQQSWLEDDDKCTFIILCRERMENTQNEVDSMIGDVNLFLNDPSDSKCAEVEIMIAETTHRGKGKGKEALLFMLRYGVEELHLEKYVAKIKSKNRDSITLFKNIGFKEVSHNAVFDEVVLECCVNDEWEEFLLCQTSAYRLEKAT